MLTLEQYSALLDEVHKCRGPAYMARRAADLLLAAMIGAGL
jgi:hypothetical protein